MQDEDFKYLDVINMLLIHTNTIYKNFSNRIEQKKTNWNFYESTYKLNYRVKEYKNQHNK